MNDKYAYETLCETESRLGTASHEATWLRIRTKRAIEDRNGGMISKASPQESAEYQRLLNEEARARDDHHRAALAIAAMEAERSATSASSV